MHVYFNLYDLPFLVVRVNIKKHRELSPHVKECVCVFLLPLSSDECGLTSIHFGDDVFRAFNFSSVVYFLCGFDVFVWHQKCPCHYNTSRRHDLVIFIEHRILTNRQTQRHSLFAKKERELGLR